jgi:hypothetical protein
MVKVPRMRGVLHVVHALIGYQTALLRLCHSLSLGGKNPLDLVSYISKRTRSPRTGKMINVIIVGKGYGNCD